MKQTQAIKCRWMSYNPKAAASTPVWPEPEENLNQICMFERLALDGAQ